MTSQSTIPFKLRKKTNIENHKEIDENDDVLNVIDDNVKRKRPKRRINNDLLKNNDSLTPLKQNTEEMALSKVNGDRTRPLTNRDKEIDWLESFLTEYGENEKSASLYISGQPGTGKTACLSYILQSSKISELYKQVYINCTLLKSSASIYVRICKELNLSTSSSTEKACCTTIEQYLNKKHKMILLVLDEIDELQSKRQSVLYKIFEWPALADSRLVLVGIANALDLTERTLPRLQTRCSLRPQLLHFKPYTKEQIIQILAAVLSKENNNVVPPAALQMLAAKIASVSGDMRRALNLGRRVIDLAKRNNSPDKLNQNRSVKEKMATISVLDVFKILDEVYGGTRKIVTANVDEEIPIHQKLILCSLILMLTKGPNKEIVAGKLHDVYKKVAKARNIDALDLEGMLSTCSLLGSSGAIIIQGESRTRTATGSGKGAGGRGRKLRLLWNEDELNNALKDKPLLSAILADSSCLPSH